ncbi:MAG: hypothetical protein A2452_05590 [Candidatus Firestonebacteria bacterium RIFOXYC2_FULL_39_67]|nr:MAG: hypothetical protein A2536_10420 [Candidatus Firestonebacteria bacterium RIFOXYD2_FULL_39_29]OGF55053.1 MAG: hypothetical protein A2497_03020 [Candidatus Firestonebacteria bacterium RifOxyC12_full_39_7]OGF56412.1 MAG: hypothetical protein A2452_05590 [Candidatus Firestonebacteria bacterium RIFOXYC2_FULL_39_67]
MKMGFLFSGVFWGVVVVVLGLLLILKAMGVNIPVGKIIFGILFIYIGISMIFWSFGGCHSGKSMPGCCNGKDRMMFNDYKIEADGKKSEYNIMFGRGDIDLSKIEVKDKDVNVKISVIFGEGNIVLNSGIPAKIRITSAFGGAVAPDGTNIAFGEYNYKNSKYKEGVPALLVDASVIFGGGKLSEKENTK